MPKYSKLVEESLKYGVAQSDDIDKQVEETILKLGVCGSSGLERGCSWKSIDTPLRRSIGRFVSVGNHSRSHLPQKKFESGR